MSWAWNDTFDHTCIADRAVCNLFVAAINERMRLARRDVADSRWLLNTVDVGDIVQGAHPNGAQPVDVDQRKCFWASVVGRVFALMGMVPLDDLTGLSIGSPFYSAAVISVAEQFDMAGLDGFTRRRPWRSTDAGYESHAFRAMAGSFELWHTWRLVGGELVAQPASVPPDVRSWSHDGDGELPGFGDYLGPWMLNECRDLLNLLTRFWFLPASESMDYYRGLGSSGGFGPGSWAASKTAADADFGFISTTSGAGAGPKGKTHGAWSPAILIGSTPLWSASRERWDRTWGWSVYTGINSKRSVWLASAATPAGWVWDDAGALDGPSSWNLVDESTGNAASVSVTETGADPAWCDDPEPTYPTQTNRGYDSVGAILIVDGHVSGGLAYTADT